MNEIIAYSLLRHPEVTLNDQVVFTSDSPTDDQFLQMIYKDCGMSYPKFHKMDQMCKTGLLATEYLMKAMGEEISDRSRVALVFSNHSSSLQTDREYLRSIADKDNYFPSPSVFVYTLPNIVTGEIAIRHKITGENAFFICEGFDPVLLFNYSELLLKGTNTDYVIAGWVEPENHPSEAFVYCVKKGTFGPLAEGLKLRHSSDSIQKLYSKKV